MEMMFPKMPFMNRTGIVFWSCLILCALVSLCTKPKEKAAPAGLIWNKESWNVPKELRLTTIGWRSPFLWWAVVTILVLYFYVKYP
jgi:SSS family solute:Na+ symporter